MELVEFYNTVTDKMRIVIGGRTYSKLAWKFMKLVQNVHCLVMNNIRKFRISAGIQKSETDNYSRFDINQSISVTSTFLMKTSACLTIRAQHAILALMDMDMLFMWDQELTVSLKKSST